jgi:DNA-directed RNA polymerase subunit F
MATIHWVEPLEQLCKKEAERYGALRWVHDEAQRWCQTWNTRIQLISFVLSVFSGAGAVGADQILPFQGSTTVVGVVSLVVSMIQTISNFLAFAKRAEGHRFASLSYGKLHSLLELQLSLPRAERKPANELLELIQEETARLNEIVPQVPADIKAVFQKRFHSLEHYAIPSILNGLEPITVIEPSTVVPATPLPMVERPKVRLEV